jgi:hypothetical protein
LLDLLCGLIRVMLLFLFCSANCIFIDQVYLIEESLSKCEYTEC